MNLIVLDFSLELFKLKLGVNTQSYFKKSKPSDQFQHHKYPLL